MKEFEIDTFLTSDYIYIPYSSKEELSLDNEGYIFKNDKIGSNYSPISGKACGITEIYGVRGFKKTLIVENDFIDKVKSREFVNENIYELDKDIIKEIVNSYIVDNTLYLYVSYNNKFDFKDYSILKDNINNILEALDVISETYSDLDIKIILNKKDIYSYQLLFNNLGTYPNINIDFKKYDNYISLYDIIDIYNKFKNRIVRDFIYVTLVYNNTFNIIKLKKYSNLKDLLEHSKVLGDTYLINNTIKLTNPNFLLDDNVSIINVN